MDLDDRLISRLGDRDATVLFVAESGVECAAPPAALQPCAATILHPLHPLAVLDDGSHPDAIAAFVTAMAGGYGSSSVVLADGTERLLEVHDIRARHGCLVTVLSDSVGVAEEVLEPDPLPIRRMITHLDPLGRIVYADDAYLLRLDLVRSELIGRPALNRVHPDDRPRVMEHYADLVRRGSGAQTRVRQRLMASDGTYSWFEITHTNRLDDDEPHVFSELLDVSDEMAVQVALEEREALLAGMTDALPIAVLHLDIEGQPVLWNEQWFAMTGCRPVGGIELLSRSIADPETLRRSAAELFDGGPAFELAIQLRSGAADRPSDTSTDEPPAATIGDRPASTRHGILRARALGPGAKRAGHLVTIEDVTELVTMQHELRRTVMTDSLTGAMSRAGIEDVIGRAIDRRDGSSEPLSLLYVDLDGFKAINDELGHRAGDRVLVDTVGVIGEALRSADRVGRIGGDEFVVLLFDADAAQARTVGERIADGLARTAVEGSSTLRISASIGVAQASPQDDFDSLVGRADNAMYRIKRRSKRS